MSTLSIPYSFSDGQSIVAAQHNSNFNAVKAFVDALSAGDNFDSQAIETASIADLAITNAKIAGNAVTLDKLATAVAEALVPTGTINAYVGATAPSGWLVCDGTGFSSTTYPALYALLGNVATTPDLTDRFIVGKSGSKAVRTTGGSATIADTQLPSHTHNNTVSLSTITGSVSVTLGGGDHTHGADTGFSGSHNHGQTVESTSSTGESHSHGTSGTAGNPDGTNTTGTDYTNATVHQHIFTTDTANAGVTVSSATWAQTGGSVSITNAAYGAGNAYWQPYYAVTYIIKAA